MRYLGYTAQIWWSWIFDSSCWMVVVLFPHLRCTLLQFPVAMSSWIMARWAETGWPLPLPLRVWRAPSMGFAHGAGCFDPASFGACIGLQWLSFKLHSLSVSSSCRSYSWVTLPPDVAFFSKILFSVWPWHPRARQLKTGRQATSIKGLLRIHISLCCVKD